MWLVAKIKKKELGTFKKELIKRFDSEIKFYNPKIQIQMSVKNKIKKFEKFILENYIFCYHKSFDQGNIINKFKFLKGLEYFLTGYNQNQDEIVKFISHCKSCENQEGYLSQTFFKTILKRKAQFVSGPFTNMIFEIIEKQKNKLKILIGNIVTTIADNKDCLYRPI